MPILVDLSQVAIASCMAFQSDLKSKDDDKIINLIRHVVLASLVSNKKKFGPKFGNLVICADARSYWRKEKFPYYKASRAKNRKDSGFNWKLIFDTIAMIKEDLAENFPYKVITVDRAEADDVVGVLCKYYQENELTQVGLEEERQKVLILSSDQDNIQMQKYSNVYQYSPMQKKAVKPPHSAHCSLIDKICCGDTGDGIPNLMSPDDIFVTEGTRQTPFRKARLEEFYALGIDACKNDTERRNFQRNQMLVDYEMIPQDLQDQIVNTYNTTEVKGSKQKIMNYFIAHRMKNLIDSIEEF